jgi:type II secretory pathway pseudopilin PulG
MRPLRNPVIQTALSYLLAGWMQFCFRTLRWTHENRQLAEAVWAQGGGTLCVFWHGRLALSPACWPLDRAQPVKGMISLSADGEFLARAMALQGIPAVRGSSANPEKGEKARAAAAKGGTQALRDGLRQIRTAIDRYEQAVAAGRVPRPADAPPGLPVYPATLELLVQGVPTGDAPDAPRLYFLRRIPRDPFAEATLPAADTWALRASDTPPEAPRSGRDVFDVMSRHEGAALDGTRYRDW